VEPIKIFVDRSLLLHSQIKHHQLSKNLIPIKTNKKEKRMQTTTKKYESIPIKGLSETLVRHQIFITTTYLVPQHISVKLVGSKQEISEIGFVAASHRYWKITVDQVMVVHIIRIEI
jgi:hypothetical protein